MSKRFSGMTRGNLSIYRNSLLRFSLDTVAMSTTSLLSVYTQRSQEFTRLRLSRQKGHDCDLVRLSHCTNIYLTDRCTTKGKHNTMAPNITYDKGITNKTLWSHACVQIPKYVLRNIYPRSMSVNQRINRKEFSTRECILKNKSLKEDWVQQRLM